MKTLYLLRHAKSSWRDPSLEDDQRPLNKRGERDAPAMAARFALRVSSGLTPAPERLLCSPAVRARATARAFRKALILAKAARRYDPRLYFQGTQAMLEAIGEFDDTVASVLLVAHNPDLTDLYNRLCADHLEWLPTCALATLQFPVQQWRQLSLVQGEMRDYDYPKRISAEQVND